LLQLTPNKMHKNIVYIAFHEAGHAIAYILTGTPFKYVTIKPDEEKDEYGGRTLGQVLPENPLSEEEWKRLSILDPIEFNVFFKDDFIKLAGLVAEAIYRRRPNYKAAKKDFRQWVGTSLNYLPERLNSKYIDFILEYTIQVIQNKTNWSNITAVALALVEEETLSYERVYEVIKQNSLNPTFTTSYNIN
jgi:hypothetical protein